MGKIVVIGSANTDLVVKTDRMPSPGETILGGSFMMSGGGKGANQAVAASRLGGEVTFVARVGNDLFGERALAGYRAERLDVRHVTRDATVPSGVALICVDGAAENSIVVAPAPTSVCRRRTSTGRRLRSRRRISSCCSSKFRCLR